MNIQKGVPLAEMTTLRVGGPARFFVRANKWEVLHEAAHWAQAHEVPLFPLGGGSNVLINDAGLNSLVIKIELSGVKRVEQANNTVVLIAGAGENWDDVVSFAVAKRLGGLENLSAIPGTVGAVPVQNVGAYGREVKDVIEWVEVFDTQTLTVKKLTNSECQFRYRDSIFRREEGERLIVTRVAFSLTLDTAPNAEYKDVSTYLRERNIKNPSIADVRTAVVDVRTAKLPDFHTVGTAGSFFKNPVISPSKYRELLEQHPEMPGYSEDNGVKIPMAWILDNVCRLKGFRKGAIFLHERQPLVIVNQGGARARDIKQFAEEIRYRVKEKTGITPDYEVTCID